MTDSNNETQKEPIYVRYAKLNVQFKKEKEKIKKLKELISQGDKNISQERYDKIIQEAEKVMAEISPELDAFKKQLDLEMNSLKNRNIELKKIKKNIDNKINESRHLFKQEIIDKQSHESELEQCKNELEPLIEELLKNEKKIQIIEKSIDKPETFIEKNNRNDPPSEPDSDPPSTPNDPKKKRETYFDKIRNSNNYPFRFLNTILIIQGLCLLMFVSCRFLLLFDAYAAIPITGIGFLLVGIFVVTYFLYMTVQSKPGVPTFLGLSVIYLVIALLIVSQIGIFGSSFDAFYAYTFMGLMAFWNLVFSILIFVAGCIRIFVIGIINDSKKKSV